ncbi:hypothetical protein ABZ820_33710 [Streptomyces diacarni]|uniref:hypothetical protein n=1 Tax=Streptomyces diacarni TaxID=2800381 RepID=UPI0033DEE581
MPGLTDPENRAEAPICTPEAARAAGLDIAPSPGELSAVAELIVSARGHEPVAEVDLARAVPLACAEIRRLRIALAVCQTRHSVQEAFQREAVDLFDHDCQWPQECPGCS